MNQHYRGSDSEGSVGVVVVVVAGSAGWEALLDGRGGESRRMRNNMPAYIRETILDSG